MKRTCVHRDNEGICIRTDEMCEFAEELHPEELCEEFQEVNEMDWSDEEKYGNWTEDFGDSILEDDAPDEFEGVVLS